MGRKRKPIYGWDTSVVLAWLKKEPVSQEADMQAVVDELMTDTAVLVVPVHLYTEVLEARSPSGEMTQFRDFLRRSNVSVVNVTMQMAIRAEKIRSGAWKEKPKRKVKTPDALFMACAVQAKVNMLHSLDPDMLNLNGSRLVDGLHICRPRTLSGAKNLI